MGWDLGVPFFFWGAAMRPQFARLFFLSVLLYSNLSSADDSACENLFAKQCADAAAAAAAPLCSNGGFLSGVWRVLRQTPKHAINIDEMNRKTLADLDATKVPAPPAGRTIGLSKAQLKQLYDNVANHPVADLKFYDKYDPNNQGIGFCFGRAMTAHLEALWTFKMARGSIKKAWVVGNMGKWGHHVATLVRGADGKWWAIDPLFGKPVDASDWYQRCRNWDEDGNMRMYVTDPKRFGPRSTAPINKAEVESDFYNSYFTDLLDQYRRVHLISNTATTPN